MKKSVLLLASLFLFLAVSAQDTFKVGDYKTVDLHNRSVLLGHSIVINALSIAKEAGMTVEEFATKMGDNWATTWNKDAGFKSLVNGTIWNHSSFLGADKPKVEITAQSESQVTLKIFKTWLPMFQNGPVFNVTEQELSTFWHVASERIANYMGAKHESKDAEEYIMYTISKK